MKASSVTIKKAVPQRKPKAIRVGIGLTSYNGSKYLKSSLASLFAQTYNNFGMVIVDDGSTDESKNIIRRYARKYTVIRFYRNNTREGMVATWRKAFELVLERFPRVEYFAWASDHDIWDKTWLERMIAELDKNPDIALCYASTQIFTNDGLDMQKRDTVFDSCGRKDIIERFSYVCNNIHGAGNMVYGVFRVSALKNTGGFQDVLLPDRLLMFELSLFGEIKQVSDKLWRRRYIPSNEKTLPKQRRTLFGKKPPLYVYLPWWLVFSLYFFRRYVIPRHSPIDLNRGQRLYITWILFYTQMTRNILNILKKKYKRLRKRIAIKRKTSKNNFTKKPKS